MFKNIATYTTFLIFTSCMYYVSFWWAFDVDIFTFFEAQDFLLGIIFPLRYSGAYLLGVVFFTGLISFLVPRKRSEISTPLNELEEIVYESEQASKSNRVHTQEELDFIKQRLTYVRQKINDYAVTADNIAKRHRRGKKFLLACITLVSLGACTATLYNPHEKLVVVSSCYILALNFYLFADFDGELPRNILGLSDDNKFWDSPLHYTLYVFCFFLPLSAIAVGYSEAQSIFNGKAFRYIMIKDLSALNLVKPQKYMIYLGAINDKVFLTDSAVTESIIIDKSVLPMLKTHSYQYNDSVSTRLFIKLNSDNVSLLTGNLIVPLEKSVVKTDSVHANNKVKFSE